MSPSQELARRARALDGVREGPSKLGNREHRAWFLGGREFAHLHSETELDARIGRKAQKRFRHDPRTVSRPNASEWLVFKLESAADVEAAFELVDTAWQLSCEVAAR